MRRERCALVGFAAICPHVSTFPFLPHRRSVTHILIQLCSGQYVELCQKPRQTYLDSRPIRADRLDRKFACQSLMIDRESGSELETHQCEPPSKKRMMYLSLPSSFSFTQSRCAQSGISLLSGSNTTDGHQGYPSARNQH